MGDPRTPPVSRTGGRSRLPIVIGIAWAVAVAAALVVTLRSLSSDDFDGLNNALQLPLAFPWSVLPSATSHTADAWVLAAFGWLNAGILCWYLSRRQRRRA